MKIVPLTKETIDEIIERASGPAQMILDLHKKVIEEWSTIERVNQYVQISRNTAKYIIDKAKKSALEKKQNPFIVTNAWVNHGFGTLDPPEEDWVAKYDEEKLIYKRKV